MTIQPSQITRMMIIAERAIEANKQDQEAKNAKACLTTAYRAFKADHDIENIERNTPEWSRMLLATSAEFQVSEAAKRKARNAARRLKTAIASLTNNTRGAMQ